MRLINSAGKLLMQKAIIAPELLDISHLSNGIYFLQLSTAQGNWQQKVLKF